MRLLVAALVALSCGPALWQPRVSTTMPPEGVDEAIAYVHQLYEETYPEVPELALTMPNVYWVDTHCPDKPGQTGIVYRGKCYAGLTWSCDEIYVAKRSTLASSALVHELGHCYRLVVHGDGDVGHVDDNWWQVNSVVNSHLRQWEMGR